MHAIRVELGIRGVTLVAVAATVGLVVLDVPGPTGAAVLAGLLLLLADFHGDPWRRFRAYLVTASAGASLILLTSATSGLPPTVFACLVGIASGLLMLLRTSGGMFAAAGTCLTADVLVGAAGGISGSDPVSFAAGALLGGLGATALSMTVLPAPWVSPVRRATVELLARCAQVLRGELPSDDLDQASRNLVGVYLARPERPASPLPSALASVNLLSDLTLLSDVLASRANTAAGSEALDARAASILEESIAVLKWPHARSNRASLQDTLRGGSLDSGDFPDSVVTQASEAIGRHALAMTSDSGTDVRGWLANWWLDARVRLAPGSTLVRAGAASALLFGGLVLASQLLKIDHPQWILLVAVSSFYPYVRRAATKAAAAVAGTVGGVLGLWILLLLDLPSESRLWWLILIVAAAVSMSSTHSPLGVIVGQGAFTLLSLTLLQLASKGITVGSAGERLADVALGAAAAVAVTAVMAPRSLRRRLRDAIAGLLITASDALGGEPQDLPDEVAVRRRRSTAAVARSQFLRCVDIADVLANDARLPRDRTIGWIDAARRAGQACAIAAVYASDTSDGADADRHSARRLYLRQAEALRAELPPPASLSRNRVGGSRELTCGRWLAHNAAIQAGELTSLVDAGTDSPAE